MQSFVNIMAETFAILAFQSSPCSDKKWGMPRDSERIRRYSRKMASSR